MPSPRVGAGLVINLMCRADLAEFLSKWITGIGAVPRRELRHYSALNGLLPEEVVMHRKPAFSTCVNWLLDGLFAALWTATIAMAVFAVYILSPFGARDRDAAREQMSADIRTESRAFCEKFGMPVGAEQHLQCVLELDKIRANEDQRTGALAGR